MGIRKTGGIRSTEKHRVLYNIETKEVVCEVEDSPNSVTLCWNDKVCIVDSDDSEDIQEFVKQEGIKDVRCKRFKPVEIKEGRNELDS
jgi:hypothetical protein